MKISPALCFVAVVFSASIPPLLASKPATKKMDANLKHHVVRFPDCELHFDYPANLVPSPDYMMDRMDMEVDYETIRWEGPLSTVSIISMDADLRSSILNQRLGSIGVLMWLTTAAKDFDGDILKPEDFKRSQVELDEAEHKGKAEDPLVESVINGRTWLYNETANYYMTPLNGKFILMMRASRQGDPKKQDKWLEWANGALGTIVGSVRIVARG